MSEVVVVGVDGSDNGDAAIGWALGYARDRDVTVRLVTAWAWEEVVGVPGARFPVETKEEGEQRAREVLDEALERADDELRAAVEIEPVVEFGKPSQVLLDAARDADLLVVGSRGRGGFKGLLLGSVSQQCVSHAPCPTVVVPLTSS